MLYVIPIEPLEERYSAQWMEWTQSFLRDVVESDYVLIHPGGYGQIQKGSFLDVIGTNVYKNHQMNWILSLFQQNKIKDGDVFWFHDMWFPGLEQLAYIRDALGMKFKIYGMLHAGTYDPHDFLTKKGMAKWAHHSENAWFSLVDGIFVATKFHKQLVSIKRAIPFNKVHVTGFPIFPVTHTVPSLKEKENIVVFPHRLDAEKNPHLFDRLISFCRTKAHDFFSDWEFIKTKEVCKTKEEYYDLLKRATFAVSFADQETWGIAMQEAVLCGCIPIVPSRLSYNEMYPERFRFNGRVESAAMVITRLIYSSPSVMEPALEWLRKLFIQNGHAAFHNMFKIMNKG